MYYLLSSILLFSLIFFIEYRRSNNSYKIKDYALINSLKNNFSVIKLLFISIIFVSFVMFVVISLEKEDLIVTTRLEFSLFLMPYILYSFLVIPFIEEYFYRFLPYSFKITNKFILCIIVFLSSMFFACLHNVGVYHSILIFFIALFFSIIYLKTGNILYSVGCHSLYNLMALVKSFTGFNNSIVFLIIFFVSFFIYILLMKKYCEKCGNKFIN